MDSELTPNISNIPKPQTFEQNKLSLGNIITIFLIITFVGILLFFLFTEEESDSINTPDSPIGKNIIPTPTFIINELIPTPLPLPSFIPTTFPSIIATPLIEQIKPTITPSKTQISHQHYYKAITRGVNLLNNISTDNQVILYDSLICELLEAKNLGKNFEITEQKIQINETDWFVKIKVRITNPDSFHHSLALDITDGIENIYLSEFSIDGRSAYPETIQPNSTKTIEVVIQVSNPHDKIYLLPRGYSSQEKLEIIPLDI